MMKELKDTIDLMTSADYKDRFKAEYWQLKIRAQKLNDMVNKYKAGKLEFTPTCPIELLEDQLEIMTGYLGLLFARASVEGVVLEGE